MMLAGFWFSCHVFLHQTLNFSRDRIAITLFFTSLSALLSKFVIQSSVSTVANPGNYTCILMPIIYMSVAQYLPT
ncbi:hypothetical protein Q6249_27975, partial [Klebsiella pneumoniae]